MKITRSAEVEWQHAIDHGNFQGRRKPLGGQKLTAGLWELPPGKKSFPLHAHQVTEEALYVLSGKAQIRSKDADGEQVTEIGPGDYVAYPPGGPAHQLINHGTEPLVYLAMSAVQGFDFVEYPDTGKMASSVGTFPTGKRFLFRPDQQPDYWEGEE
jgi:uncharacterized cupin superfamily protein